MSQKWFVKYVKIFLFILSSAYSDKHDVLLILIDDLRHLSTENITLSNINKATAKGVTFKNAYAQQALCGPSRNSLLTGRRPDSLRLYDFFSYWRDAIANFTTIPQYFKENGYDTYSIGKVFHPGKCSNFTDDYPYSWSNRPFHPPTEIYKDAAVCSDVVTKKLQKNLICPVSVDDQPRKTLPDLESLDYAISVLKRKRTSSKPLFLAIGFHKPHIPLKFPKHYLHKVPIGKVQPPKYPFVPKELPAVAWHPWSDVRSRDDIKRLHIQFPFGTMPQKWALKIRQSYFAAATYIDDLIGALLSHVNLRKTVVVLTSDHGWSLGENGLWAKYSNFNVALRVPLIFLAPGLKPKIIDSPVELIDIFPTLLDLTGLKHDVPQCINHADKTNLCFEGKNLVTMMKRNQRNANVYALSQYPRPSIYPQKDSDKPRLKNIKIMGYSIKTRRYRYTEWVSFNTSTFIHNWNEIYGLELYDHLTDTDESNNLDLVSKYKNVRYKLSKLLRSQVNIKHFGNE